MPYPKPSMKQIRHVAASQGGECLSKEFVSSQHKMLWRCGRGHEWWADWNKIQQGRWCRVCRRSEAARKRRKPVHEVITIITKHKGTLLSVYGGKASSELKIRCRDGHEFTSNGNRLQAGLWCPYCKKGISEQVCRILLANILNTKLPTTRPKWLMYKNGKPLELDGYSESLHIAFEYQGPTHFRNARSMQNWKLENQWVRDKFKRRRCKEEGVTLIEVPYTIPHEELHEYLLGRCEELGLKIQNRVPADYSKAFTMESELEKLKRIAESRGGKLLTKKYFNSQKKMHWECSKGHRWYAPPASIKMGYWCQECGHTQGGAKRRNATKERLQEYAKNKGGVLLSYDAVDGVTTAKWSCKRGHKWSTRGRGLDRRWCRECGFIEAGKIKRDRTLQRMREYAKKRGGKLLSKSYSGKKNEFLDWECAKGHTWSSTATTTYFSKCWCPTCAGRQKN